MMVSCVCSTGCRVQMRGARPNDIFLLQNVKIDSVVNRSSYSVGTVVTLRCSDRSGKLATYFQLVSRLRKSGVKALRHLYAFMSCIRTTLYFTQSHLSSVILLSGYVK
jgi:hypothetical protein